jgi:hypothetical protein
MHFQLPKPLHGWREFAGEVGIIVLGVLIALSAQQVAEHFNRKAELRDAEDAMRAELRDDDLPQAFMRAALYKCYSGQLNSIDDAIARGDRTRFTDLAAQYQPVFRTWDDEAWKAAVASQVLVPSGSKRMIEWSANYVTIPILSQTSVQEANELPKLTAKLSGTGPITAAQQDRLFQVTSGLRLYNRRMSLGSLAFMNFAHARGLTLTPKDSAALLTEAREKYPNGCVTEPRPEQLRMTGQASPLTDAEAGYK